MSERRWRFRVFGFWLIDRSEGQGVHQRGIKSRRARGTRTSSSNVRPFVFIGARTLSRPDQSQMMIDERLRRELRAAGSCRLAATERDDVWAHVPDAGHRHHFIPHG
jgi:hypothetical protein